MRPGGKVGGNLALLLIRLASSCLFLLHRCLHILSEFALSKSITEKRNSGAIFNLTARLHSEKANKVVSRVEVLRAREALRCKEVLGGSTSRTKVGSSTLSKKQEAVKCGKYLSEESKACH